jgi:hypothetical protein
MVQWDSVKGLFIKAQLSIFFGVEAAKTLDQLGKGECGLSH